MPLTTVAYLLAAFSCVSLFLTLLAHASVFALLRPRKKPHPARSPGITVLKPVKGAEPGLYENLASLARQDYSDFEILVGAEDPRDQALAVARQVQRDYPAARISIQSGARALGLNPKVNLLVELFARARHDAVLISDSNVRVGSEYLREIARELSDPAVGLVTNIVVGEGEGTGALLESLHLNGFVASATSLARVAAQRACVIGKSMLLRRSDLERMGGLRAVSNVLAEDFLIGRMYELAGFRVALSSTLVRCVNEGWSVERFVNRHLRWAQMRRRISPAAYLAELLLNPLFWLVLAAAALRLSRPEAELRWAALFASGVAVKCALDAALWRKLRGRMPRPAELMLIPVKDTLIAGIWLLGFFRRRVSWRGNDLCIGAGSRLAPLRPAGVTARDAAWGAGQNQSEWIGIH